MRKIKFRGKTDITKEWIFGDFEHWNNGVAHISGRDFSEAVIPDTVGQFTGLHDRVGNEIYEGDIIELVFPNRRIDVEYVSFNEGRFVSIDPQKPYRKESLYLFLDCTKVIGNIHDTPEFLNSIAK